MKKCAMVCVVLLVVMVNPMLVMSGCTFSEAFDCGEPPPVDYSERDIERELLSVPRIQSVMLEDGTTIDVSFRLDESQFARATTRPALYEALGMSLIQSAHACSFGVGRSVEFEGRVDIVRTTPDGLREVLFANEPVSGRYEVESMQLDTGTLSLELSSESALDGDLWVFYRTMDGRGQSARITELQVDAGSERVVYNGF